MKAHSQFKALALGVAFAIGAGSIAYTPQSHAQWVVTDPAHTMQTIFAEVTRAMDAANDYAQQLRQIQNQVTQLQNDARNLTSLPTNIMGDYQRIYGQYARQVQELQGLMGDLSQVRDQYQQMYPDLANGNQSFEQLSALTRQWEQSGRQNIEDALAGGAAVLDTLDDSQQDFQQLGDASQSAEGALQAMQAGNQINMMVGQELMKLNAQTAMYQQTVLAEQARTISIQTKARENNRRASAGWGTMQSDVAPAAKLGSN